MKQVCSGFKARIRLRMFEKGQQLLGKVDGRALLAHAS